MAGDGGLARERLFPQGDLLGLPAATAEREQAIAARRKAGRPPGSRNKRQEDAARHVIEVFGDPLVHLVAIATMDVDELVARAGCSAFEAIQEKRLAAIGVLPYLHSRKPLAVDVSNRRIVHLTVLAGDAAGTPGVTLGATADTLPIVEFQAVSEGDADAV